MTWDRSRVTREECSERTEVAYISFPAILLRLPTDKCTPARPPACRKSCFDLRSYGGGTGLANRVAYDA